MKMAQFTLKSVERLAHPFKEGVQDCFYLKLIKILFQKFKLNTDVTAEGFKCTIVNQFCQLINCFYCQF